MCLYGCMLERPGKYVFPYTFNVYKMQVLHVNKSVCLYVEGGGGSAHGDVKMLIQDRSCESVHTHARLQIVNLNSGSSLNSSLFPHSLFSPTAPSPQLPLFPHSSFYNSFFLSFSSFILIFLFSIIFLFIFSVLTNLQHFVFFFFFYFFFFTCSLLRLFIFSSFLLLTFFLFLFSNLLLLLLLLKNIFFFFGIYFSLSYLVVPFQFSC